MKRAFHILTLGLALMAASTLASAQEKHNNWFIGAGVGVNMLYDNGYASLPSPAASLYVGDWFTPVFGFRAGMHGIMARPASGYETWFSDDTVFGCFQVHADGMWNIMNTFTPYKYKRVWNPALYARVSGILGSSLGTNKFHAGVGGGLLNQFRVGDQMSIVLDLNAVVTNEKTFRKDHSGNLMLFCSATLGVVFDLGNRGF